MPTSTNTIEQVHEHTQHDEEVNSLWKPLLPKLAPAVVAAVRDPSVWKHLEPELVRWLNNTASQFPWLNQLALAGMLYSRDGGVDAVTRLIAINSFLRWAIPDQAPDVVTLKPLEALLAYYGDPPQQRGLHAYQGYLSLQFHMQRFLETVSAEQRIELAAFLLPTLVPTPRLKNLRTCMEQRVKASRKVAAFAVTNVLPNLIAMGRRRHQWLTTLAESVRNIANMDVADRVNLPVTITLTDLDGVQEIAFRVWDRLSWIKAHQTGYQKPVIQRAIASPLQSSALIVQLIGSLPETPWFLRAIALGRLQGTQMHSHSVRGEHAALRKVPDFGRSNTPGVLAADHSTAQLLHHAQRTAAGTPEDSTLLFAVEPLLAAASIGLFTLVSLVSTAMRLGELQQVTLDHECMEYGRFPEYDDATQRWVDGPKRLFWRLFPKGSQQRERYVVTALMSEALFVMLDLHKRYYGADSIKAVYAAGASAFPHTRRFRGKHKFVLQWAGRHLPQQVVSHCLAFLLLEHGCRDAQGHLVNITAHLFRHGVAGWLRNNGIPLEDIMLILKQVNLAVTDYYSQPSPEELHHQMGPALTMLADLAGTDPSTVRTVGDIQHLAQTALKQYGVLRRTPGGLCATFSPCQVQFKCAGCSHYVPDPQRRGEVREKITMLSKGIQLYESMGDALQADGERAHRRDWERVLREMDGLSQVQLASPSAQEMLGQLVDEHLGDELRRDLMALNRLVSGEDKING